MSLLGWIIAKIIKLYYKTTCLLGKHIGLIFSKIFIFISQHIKFFFTALIILFCSLLRIQHSKIGLFVACKDYISQSYFQQPCKVVLHYPNVQAMHVKVDKEVEKKK